MKISFKVLTQKKASLNEAQTSTQFSNSFVGDDNSKELTDSRKRRIICLEKGVVLKNDDNLNKKKKEYFIPLASTQDWRISKLQAKIESGSATPEDEARLALMLETIGEQNAERTGEKVISNNVEEYDDPKFGSKVEADYNAVPVEEFGLAFLRGCGWKREDGIGRTNKKVVPLFVSNARPTGLGLGSQISTTSEKNKKLN